jgi:hypothetical protein
MPITAAEWVSRARLSRASRNGALKRDEIQNCDWDGHGRAGVSGVGTLYIRANSRVHEFGIAASGSWRH